MKKNDKEMDYREKIMEEFIRLFVQKSCKDINVDEIAENLGISKRTIYETFSSKGDIIKQTLNHYQTLAHSRTLEYCRGEVNPLKNMLKMSFFIIENLKYISMARLVSLKKYYPEIAEELIQEHCAFMKDSMLKTYYKAQDEGYIFSDIEPEFLLALLISGERDPRQRTIHFMGKEHDVIKLFSAHLFTIIRGVSTLQGVEICDAFFKEYLKDKIFS